MARSPVQCTDDLADTDMTGQEVPVENLQNRNTAQDTLATDAVRFEPPRPRPAPAAAAAAAAAPQWIPGAGGVIYSGGDNIPDKIVIPGEGGRGNIVATGLAQHARPGVQLQIGHTNTMTVYHGRDGGSFAAAAGPAAFIHNRLQITRSQDRPGERHLTLISREVSQEWRLLGRNLALVDSTLDQISMDFRAEGQLEVNRQMLRKWMETSHPATMNSLAQALANIGRGDLSDRLSEFS